MSFAGLAWASYYTGHYGAADDYAREGRRVVGSRAGSVITLTSLNLGHTRVAQERLTAAVESYEEALALCKEVSWPAWAATAQTGLARIALQMGRTREAMVYVEDVLDYADRDLILYGAWDPINIYLSCYRVLSAVADPRADEVLVTAHELMHEWANEIEDAELRRAYLENVPENQALADAFCERE